MVPIVAITFDLHTLTKFPAEPGIQACTISFYIHSTGIFVYANHSLPVMLKAVPVAKVSAW